MIGATLASYRVPRTARRLALPSLARITTSISGGIESFALRVYMNVVVVKKHIADNDLSATYRSLVIGIVGVIDEKSIE
jgi:hypothetical protein